MCALIKFRMCFYECRMFRVFLFSDLSVEFHQFSSSKVKILTWKQENEVSWAKTLNESVHWECFLKNRKIFVLILLGAICLSATQTTAREVACEKIENRSWFDTLKRTCFMNQGTVIDTPDTMIIPFDQSVLGLWLNNNKNIKFLPRKIHQSFPDLVGFSAYSCSLTTIEKENFVNLTKLKYLDLRENRLTKLHDNLFEDLAALEVLWLGE